MSSQFKHYPQGGFSVGSLIDNGGPNRILFLDSSGKLADSANFQWIAGSNTMQLGNVGGGLLQFIPLNGSGPIINFPTFSINGDGQAYFAYVHGTDARLTDTLFVDSIGSNTNSAPVIDIVNGYLLDQNNTQVLGFGSPGEIDINGLLYVSGQFLSDVGQIVTDGIGGLTVQTLTSNGRFYCDAASIYSDGAGTLTAPYVGTGVILNAGQASINTASGYLYDGAGATVTLDYHMRALRSPNGVDQMYWDDSGVRIPTKVYSYGGNTTQGIGVTPVLGYVTAVAQTSTIGATNFFFPTTGLYDVGLVLWASTAGTSGTVTVSVSWNDGTAARSYTSPAITFGSLAAPVTINFPAWMVGTTTPTYSATVTAAVGSPKYDFRLTATRKA